MVSEVGLHWVCLFWSTCQSCSNWTKCFHFNVSPKNCLALVLIPFQLHCSAWLTGNIMCQYEFDQTNSTDMKMALPFLNDSMTHLMQQLLFCWIMININSLSLTAKTTVSRWYHHNSHNSSENWPIHVCQLSTLRLIVKYWISDMLLLNNNLRPCLLHWESFHYHHWKWGAAHTRNTLSSLSCFIFVLPKWCLQ